MAGVIGEEEANVPANLMLKDWRDEDSPVLIAVRHQGETSSCWAMAVIAAIAAIHKIKNPHSELLNLSPQELIDCCVKRPERRKNLLKDGKGCYAYYSIKAFEYVMMHGILREQDYPFAGRKQHCKAQRTEGQRTTINGYLSITIAQEGNRETRNREENEIMKALGQQPVIGTIEVYSYLTYIGDRIYEGRRPAFRGESNGLHEVLLVGCGTDINSKRNYWVAQNSWGTEWGMDGYFKILRPSSQPRRKKPVVLAVYYPVLT